MRWKAHWNSAAAVIWVFNIVMNCIVWATEPKPQMGFHLLLIVLYMGAVSHYGAKADEYYRLAEENREKQR